MDTKNTTIDGKFDATVRVDLSDVQIVDRLMAISGRLRRGEESFALKGVMELIEDIVKKQEKSS